MPAERINRIDIEWQGLFKPIEGLKTAPDDDPLINQIAIRKETLPIVFVPGIMGSRLKKAIGDDKVWDPDANWFMLSRFGLPHVQAEDRKKMLVGEQSHQSHYLKVDADNLEVPEEGRDRGWGAVAWQYYGALLDTLAGHEWPAPLDVCFDFPVHAFGYNWTDSNHASGRALADYIDRVIEAHAKIQPCRQVILVAHSMGGLVARSACKLHGAESKVLGVLHGAQPAFGAPAAYQRIKHGFRELDGSLWDWLCHPIRKISDTLTARVLGDEGPEVTLLMAHMPGGLELLPTRRYRTNDGRSAWLHYRGRGGYSIDLPRRGDPYDEIYSARQAPFRLIDPRWLGESKEEDYEENYGLWSYYLQNLNKAKRLHANLDDYAHPETYQFYGTALETADRIEISCQKFPGRRLFDLQHLEGKHFFEFRDASNKVIDTDHDIYLDDPVAFEIPNRWHTEPIWAYAVAPPKGSGDGTVPDASGRALTAKPSFYDKGPDGTVDIDADDESDTARTHDRIFNTETARHITIKAIENLCKAKIRRETGV